jgi:hypothetical protein
MASEPVNAPFILRRPETVLIREWTRKRFRPAVPKRKICFTRSPEPYGFQRIGIPDFLSIALEQIRPLIPVSNQEQFTPVLDALEYDSGISRHPDNCVSLREEMVDLSDLDYGKYGAMVSHSSSGFIGFLEISSIRGECLTLPEYRGIISHWYPYPQDLKNAVIRLSEGMNQYTGIRTRVGQHRYLSSRQIFSMPLLYITTDAVFELTDTERDNFGAYLRNGGFAVLENAYPKTELSPGYASLRNMIRDALGASARIEPIPRKHPLFHCFFVFPDGPPIGSEIDMFNWPRSGETAGFDGTNMRLAPPVHYLEGVFLRGHLVAVLSNKGYGLKWKQLSNCDPQLKMGVNFVVYALAREGGMTQRVMERYADVQ